MHCYFLFYKPFQVLTQFSPEEGKRTLSDFLGHLPKDVYPVGRLDYDSEGLLLLTNDKDLTYRLLEPRFGHKRTYWVQVENVPDAPALKRLQQGVQIQHNGKPYQTRPAQVHLLHDPEVPDRNPPIRYRKNIPAAWISLTITEGKNRQVRKMTAAAGFPTLRLIRHSIGSVSVDGLVPGACREAGPEIRKLLLQ